jgi:hypothetical protein
LIHFVGFRHGVVECRGGKAAVQSALG